MTWKVRQPQPSVAPPAPKQVTLLDRLKIERANLEDEWLKGNQKLIELDMRIAQVERGEKAFPWFKDFVDWYKAR
jgi:hypothetical protein